MQPEDTNTNSAFVTEINASSSEEDQSMPEEQKKYIEESKQYMLQQVRKRLEGEEREIQDTYTSTFDQPSIEDEVLPADRMSLMQVGLVSACFASSGLLVNYITSYLCDRPFFMRDTNEQLKASSFLTQWMHLTIPKLIAKFKAESKGLETKHTIPTGSFNQNFECLFTILDESQKIYDTRTCYTSSQIVQTLHARLQQTFGAPSREFVKKECLTQLSFQTSPYFTASLEAFCRAGGFDMLLMILKNSVEKRAVNDNYNASLPMFIQVVSLVNKVKEFINTHFIVDYVHQLRSICLLHAQHNIEEESLRRISKQDISAYISNFESILIAAAVSRGSPVNYELEVYQFSEQLELELALKCIKMPILEKKFLGHALLTHKVNQVNNANQPKGHVSTLHQLRQKWLTSDRLVEWMNQNQVLNIMLGESTHTEVIKKSMFLLEFLYQHNQLGAEQIGMIWDCAVQRHEVYRIAVLKSLILLVQNLKSPELRFLLDKVKRTPHQQTDRSHLQLLKAIVKNLHSVLIGKQTEDLTKALASKRRLGLLFADGPSSKTKPQRRSSDAGLQTKKGIEMVSQSLAALDDHDLNKLRTHGQIKKIKRGGSHVKPPSVENQSSQQSQNPREEKIDSDAHTGLNVSEEDLQKQKIENANLMENKEEYNLNRNNFRAEEEKQEINQTSNDEATEIYTLQHIMFEPTLQLSDNQISETQNLSLNEVQEMKRLTIDTLYQIWLYCQEDKVGPNKLSRQVHMAAIETLCGCLTQQFPLFSFYFMKLCMTNVQRGSSVVVSQLICQKLIEGIMFPILPVSQVNQIPDFAATKLPKNRNELIQALEIDLDISKAYLNAYVDFKRQSLQTIFERFAANMDNDILGGGDQDENLETQSSLDNNTNKNTGEERSRFSKSIASSHKSEKAGSTVQRQIATSTKRTVQTNALFIQEESNLENSHGFEIEPKSACLPQEEVQPPAQAFENFQTIKAQSLNEAHQITEHQPSEPDKNFEVTSKAGKKEVPENLAPPEQAENQNQNRQFLTTLVTNQALQLTYLEEMVKRLDFIKFLVKESHCKILKNEQINILWECLVVNAFTEDERDLFFTFCIDALTVRQIQQAKVYQAQNLAKELLFEEDTFETIFFEILLRLDFKGSEAGSNSFTQTMYLCFERFFMYINEQYGQIVTSPYSLSSLVSQGCVTWHSQQPQFDIYDHSLIGMEALWEIVMSVQDKKIQTRALQFLMKLYKSLDKNQEQMIQEIPEIFYNNCMSQIRNSLVDISTKNNELIHGPNLTEEAKSPDINLECIVELEQLHPDLVHSASIDESNQRITRSIQLMREYIADFENMGSLARAKDSTKEEVHVFVNNHISNCWPNKISLKLFQSTKIGELKEQIVKNLNQPKAINELSLLYRGKELDQDLLTLKESGMKSLQADGSHNPVKVMLSIRSIFEQDLEAYKQPKNKQYSDQELSEAVENLRAFLGDFMCSEEVVKVALTKCKLNLEEAIFILTDTDQVNDIEDELRRETEIQQQREVLANKKVVLQEEQIEEKKLLNEMISNRSECFDLLFDLLNLGVPEITQASWALLMQVPVNPQLLSKIRLQGENTRQLSQVEWSKIIDPSSIHKMLYSLQLVNQLITINNEKLSETEIQERYEWRQRFLELGGFNHLYFILINYDFDFVVQTHSLFTSQGKTQANTKGKGKKKMSKTGEANSTYQGQSHLFERTQAQCLGYLTSIIKIFLQAAILSNDQKNLLTLIASTITSPFKKTTTSNQPQIVHNYGQENSSSGEAVSDKSGGSSVNTPKFANSFVSNQAGEKLESEELPKDNDKSVSTGQVAHPFVAQVDDFPRLIEQMRQKKIAQNLLQNVVDFSTLIQKLLIISYTSICVFSGTQTNQFDQMSKMHLQGNKMQTIETSDPIPFLVQNCFDLLLPCILWEPQTLIQHVFDFNDFEKLLVNGLLTNSNDRIRKSIEQTFKVLCNQIEERFKQQAENEISKLKVFLLKILLKNLPVFQSNVKRNFESEYYDEFFNLMAILIKLNKKNEKSLNPEAVLKLCNETIHTIQNQLQTNKRVSESKQIALESLLCGHLLICQSILETYPELKQITVQHLKLVESLTSFIFGADDNLHQKKSINPLGRAAKRRSFATLQTLSDSNEVGFKQTLDVLFKFLNKINRSWRYINLNEIDADVGLKQASGFVGLKNFGCTCYMNSLLQQLYMITALRNNVLNVNFPESSQLGDNLLYQLQVLFANLQESEKQYFIPKGFVNTFKFYGEPVNVRVQQDTHEFYAGLCDQIEQLIPKTESETDEERNFLKRIVGGSLCNETKSLEENFPYVGEKEEPFYALTLDIKNKKSIQEALDAYIKPDVLEGDDKYHCEQYDRKISAQRRTYLKDLSGTVVLNLKRFEFDYHRQQRFKINDYCEFPEFIDFRKWTKEGISEAEQNSETNQADLADQEDILKTEGQEIEEEESSSQIIKVQIDPNQKRRVRSNLKQRNNTLFEESKPLNLSGEFSDIEAKRGLHEASQDQTIKAGPFIDQEVTSQDAKSLDSNDQQRIEVSKSKQLASLSRRSLNVSRKHKTIDIEQTEEEKPSQYLYQLVGVLVHSGSTDSGHYYSFIKERNKQSVNYGKWFEFNDTVVKDFNFANLKKECFGGQQKSANDFEQDDNPSNRPMFERCCNAYLIFYEKVEQPTESKVDETTTKNDKIIREIQNQNQAFKNLKIYNDSDFIKFAIDYVKHCNFNDVLYFPQELSDTIKIKHLKKLTQEYIQDWERQKKLLQRKAETQQLRNQQITPTYIHFEKDYYSEQVNIQYSKVDSSIFMSDEEEDVGFKTIKLATVLAQDLLLKLDQVQSYVQLVQQLTQMYQSHAISCVWFIKWITDQPSMLSHLLLHNNPEVREVFANLVTTTFAVTIRNEEQYLGLQDQIADFECDQRQIDNFEVKNMQIPKAASVRLVKIMIEGMMLSARANWRNFKEYFLLLKDFAQSHFQMAAYFIHSNMIEQLLDFVMNNKPPFNNNRERMGDNVQQPDFQPAYDLLAYLIQCCLTKGISEVRHYSPYSVFQEESKQINLPEYQVMGLLTTECFCNEILMSLPFWSQSQTNAVERILVHLSWGDNQVSLFLIGEIVKHIKVHKTQINQLQHTLKLLQVLLLLEDNVSLKTERMKILLGLKPKEMLMDKGFTASPSSQDTASLGFVHFLSRLTDFYPIYVLFMLNFIGNLAVYDKQSSFMLETLKDNAQEFKQWVLQFVSRSSVDATLTNRAQSQFGIKIETIQEQTLIIFKEILQIEDGQAQYATLSQREPQMLPIPVAPAAPTQQSLKHYEPMNEEGENIVNLIGNSKKANDSFSGIPELKSGGSPQKMLNFYEEEPAQVNQSFGGFSDEIEKAQAMKNQERTDSVVNPLTFDEDDVELSHALGNMEVAKNPFKDLEPQNNPEFDNYPKADTGGQNEFRGFDLDYLQYDDFGFNMDSDFLKKQQEEYEALQNLYKTNK